MRTITLKSSNKRIYLHTTVKSVKLIQRVNSIVLKHVGLRGLPGESGDKNYVQSFTNSSEVTVSHLLGKRPSISVEDSSGNEVEGEVSYIDLNTMMVRFSSSFTGRVICN